MNVIEPDELMKLHSTEIVSARLRKWIRGVRRWLHRYPELSFEEYKTSAYIAKVLESLGIPFQNGIARTGVVAELGDLKGSGPCVALRADMDALPIEEKTGLPFSSLHPGKMHACGHDGHVAMLLGAAAVLKNIRLDGKIRLIFQPAEEGEGGAKQMVREGVLDGVDAIFGGHIDRHFRPGEIAVQPGLICAFTDTFRIEIRGKGGHAAKPHETVDSIVVASLLVMSIQTLVSREVDPAYPTVVTVGSIRGGSAPNVIAESAVLEGTIRSTHSDVRRQVTRGLKRMVKSMGDLYGAETSIEMTEGFPPVINDPKASEVAREAAASVVGSGHVAGLKHPSLGGEDFSYFLKKVPGCFVRFGAAKKGLENVPAHSPYFDFDESALPMGSLFLVKVALKALERLERGRF